MENTEKRVIELEPQTIDSAHKISGDIMDAAKKMFGLISGIIHLQDFCRPTILIASSLTVTDIFI